MSIVYICEGCRTNSFGGAKYCIGKLFEISIYLSKQSVTESTSYSIVENVQCKE